MKKKVFRIFAPVAVLAAMATPAMAEGEPINLASAGTAIAAFIPTGAGWGVPILIGLVGLRVIIKSFRGTAK